MGRPTPINKIRKNINLFCKFKFINISCTLCITISLIIKIITSVAVAHDSQNNQDFYYKSIIIDKQLVQTVTVNPEKYKIINENASTINKNVAYVEQIAKKHQALMAINGGFFRKVDKHLYVPAGALKSNNIWQGITYHSRASIGWKPNTNLVLIDRLKTQTSIIFGNTKLRVTHFNPHNNLFKQINYSQNKIIIYSSIYPDFNTLNLLNPQNFPIEEQGKINYIYNLNNITLNKFDLIDLISSKLKIEIFPQLDPDTRETWNNIEFITSGAPILMKNHLTLTDYNKEKIAYNFINNKHARTAICILDNGFWKFVKVPNMTIPELTNLMVLLKCKDAINLDGGGSSEMYLSNIPNYEILTNIVNPITDIIMVLPN